MTKEEAKAGYYDTPSAPTPGEVEDMSIQQAIDKIEDWVEGNIDLDYSHDAMAFTRLLRSVLSSHASKAREEGRKEGAEEQWEKDKLAVKESEQPWWKNEKALKALSQTNPKKEI